ncbi:MAG TPA: alkaline phosphatase family protein [Chthonomonadaceae bacterium]|nr:alkaline phosphatase family protein [Chthonomonadaceae bacterium]
MPSFSDTTVVLVSIDGMRPDALLEADTPTMDRLMARGAVSLTAQAVMPSVTLPCHTSMLRGVDTPRHGITTNTFQPLARPVPSLIDAAHAADKRCGFFYNWGQLRDLCEPASLDVSYCRRDCYSLEGDWRVAQAAAEHVADQGFDFLFVYLGYTDECGHREGWMSRPYLQAIANADRCIGHVLEACERAGQEPIVLVQSDHGGHGRSHGTDGPEDMTIPWVLSGPGIRAGLRLDTPVRIYDTCPTLAALLGLPPAREWEGRVIEEAFEKPL